MTRQKLSPEEYMLRRRESVKKWHSNNKNKVKKHTDKWSDNNKEYFREWHACKRQNDPMYVLKSNIRALITNSFKYKKPTSTENILGCTLEEFKLYIEDKFEPWMNWDNHGGRNIIESNMSWDLDHITPVSSAVDECEVKLLNHYTNFQPLCSYVNRFVKRNKHTY
jgi:hypothetical protein